MPPRPAAIPARAPALAQPKPGPAGPTLLPDDPPGPPSSPPTGRGRHRRRDATDRLAAAAVGYLRRSTDRQEQSIPDQKKAVEAYCAQHGFRLLRCYTDDAVSGTSTLGRHAFQEMVLCAQSSSRDFGVIVAYDVKRFGRVGNDEAGYWRHLLRGCCVEVRYAAEGFTGDGTDDLLRPVKQWQAREESKDLSKVTIRGLLSKSTTGFWMGGAPPFGYDLRYESQAGQVLLTLRYHADGTKLALDEQGRIIRTLERGESLAVSRRDRCRLVPSESSRAETVRRIFRLYAEEGRGFKAVADALNREKVPTARGPQWAGHYSGQWSLTTVRAILINPAYCGDMVWNRRTDARFHRIGQGRAVERREAFGRRLERNDEEDWITVRDAHEPLVERAVWEAAQRRLASVPASVLQRGVNPRTGAEAGAPAPRSAPGVVGGWTGPRAKFLLTGLCSCVRCSSRYEGYTQRSRVKREDGSQTKRHSYACGGYIRRGPSVCRLGEVDQEPLEGAVVDAVRDFYARYEGPQGRERLAAAAQAGLGEEHRKAEVSRAQVEARLRRVEEITRNLLDSLTPENKQLVQGRLEELARERDSLTAKAQTLERLILSRREVGEGLKAAARFLGELGVALGEGASAESAEALGSRQAALRRCVRRVWVDAEGLKAQVELVVVPGWPGQGEGAATEMVKVAFGETRRRRGRPKRKNEA